MNETCLADDPLFFAIVDNRVGTACGVASYLNITPASGAIEVGHIHYSPQLQRTPLATEAMYLMMKEGIRVGLSALLLEVRQPKQSIAGSRPTAGTFV